LPSPTRAGKRQTVTIEPGCYDVTDAQSNKRTGDPQVRLRAAGEPEARVPRGSARRSCSTRKPR
jgi:hypothetical protein